MDVRGFTFLEQYFTGLELFVEQSPEHHALFERVLPSMVVGAIVSLLVYCEK